MNFWYIKHLQYQSWSDFVTNLNVSNSSSMYIDYKQKNWCIVIINYFSKVWYLFVL